jgi:hypothetical protein
MAKTRFSVSSPSWLPPVGIALAALLLGAAVSVPATARVAIAMSATVPAAAIALRRPTAALYGLVVWLAALATLRRLTTGISGAFSFGDPLLLVGPVILVAITLVAVHRGGMRDRSPLTNAPTILVGALALSVLNPLQGGVDVGAGGAVLVLVPMLAFFVGRSLVSDAVLRRVLWLYAALAIPAAAYGLLQTFVRFPSWDQRWIDEVQTRYVALNVGGVIRAFASFASGAEFAMFLAVGVVCWLTLGSASRWRLLVAPVIGLLVVAIWYESARAVVVLLVASLAFMLAARLGLRIGSALLLGTVAIVAIPWTVGIIAPAGYGSNPDESLAAHQVSGLSDPFGESSSLHGHIDIAVDAIVGGLHDPLGRGVGSVTVAAGKLGGTGGSAEVDPANAAAAAGLVGLGAYLCVVILGIRRAFNRARRRDALSLAALGVLFATLLQWLNGGQYAVAILPWLVLGWLDRPERRLWTTQLRSNKAPESVRESNG